MSRVGTATRSMRHLGRSIGRLTWAGALLGTGGLTSAKRVAAGLDALSLEARRQLDPLPQVLFQAGDDLQSDFFDRLPRNLHAGAWRNFSSGLLDTAATSLRVLRPDAEGLAARRELAHKFSVYTLVRRASDGLGDDAATRVGFERAVAQARQLDPRQCLWALEGIAHGHTRAALAGDHRPRGLLADTDLPEGDSLMAHLGLGMALAEHLLQGLEAGDETGLRRVLLDFVELCADNSQPEHGDAALEALGLVTRCFFPELTSPIGRLLVAPEEVRLDRIAELYWHGVGRAIYFLPLHLLPAYGTIEAGLARVDAEAPNPRARVEARAGFAYAATLVNLGSPVVLERLVVRSPKSWDVACTEGMISAVLMRRRVTPEDPELAAFLAHEPGEPAAREPWRQHVMMPLQRALHDDAMPTSTGSVVRRTLHRDAQGAPP